MADERFNTQIFNRDMKMVSVISPQLKKWQGRFGREYTERNILSLNGMDKLYKRLYGVTRTELNKLFLNRLSRSMRILEIGTNIGNQLLYLKKMGFKDLYGIEPQQYAIDICRPKTKGLNIIKGNIFDIPFKDEYFDLVFTSGVLIHINPKDIKKAMKEIYRCTKRYIWGLEYYSDKYTEVIYRGQRNLLWKADFVKMYLDNFKDLVLVKEKKLKYLDSENVDSVFLLKKVKR